MLKSRPRSRIASFYPNVVLRSPSASATEAARLIEAFDESAHFTDGYAPEAGVIQGMDGNFYGMTALGGISTACDGGTCGTIFKLTPTGKFLSLHSFQFTDGEEPTASLAQSSTGALYGSTNIGGNTGFEECSTGCGTVLKASFGGAFDVVHKFNGSDGGGLRNALIQATDGAFYGESPLGGDGGEGEIFKIVLPRTLVADYSFNSAIGVGDTALVQGTGGKFYGTYEGDPSGVFSFDVGLGPFVTFVIPAGKVSHAAQILGQG